MNILNNKNFLGGTIMEAREFARKWSGDELICYDNEVLKKFHLSEKDRENLSQYGLPESAAPYLNFENIDMQNIENLEEGYFYLGYTGNGDWICININSGKILIIAHEMYDYEDEYEEDQDDESDTYQEDDDCEDYDYEGYTLVNSSLEAFYEFILKYEELMQKKFEEGTEEFRKNVEILKETFISIDNEAMKREDCFWNEEIDNLLYG